MSKERQHEEFAAAISWAERNLANIVPVDRINSGDATIGSYRVCYEGEGWSVYGNVSDVDDEMELYDDDMDPIEAVDYVIRCAVSEAMESALVELNLDSNI